MRTNVFIQILHAIRQSPPQSYDRWVVSIISIRLLEGEEGIWTTVRIVLAEVGTPGTAREPSPLGGLRRGFVMYNYVL